MDENKVVLCGANAYEKKYYFNEEQFKMIPGLHQAGAACDLRAVHGGSGRRVHHRF